MSRVVYFVAATLAWGCSAMASGAPVSSRVGSSMFASEPIGDDRLAAIIGTGRGRLGSLVDDEWYGFQRQSAALAPVAMDNWWHDVGNQVIAANILIQRGIYP